MEITRDVILDLLPMYLANEVSENTRTIIEKYLETDPELAKMAKQLAAINSARDIPVPLTEDDKLKAYKKAKRAIVLRSIILAGIAFIILVLAALTLFIFLSSPGLSHSELKDFTPPTASPACAAALLSYCNKIDNNTCVNVDSHCTERRSGLISDRTAVFLQNHGHICNHFEEADSFTDPMKGI